MFVEVVRAGSFAEASRRLRIPPNRVSRKIQQLEERLNTQLLRRSTRKLALTDAGQAFYDRCANPVAELSNASQALISHKRLPSGLLRIAATANFFDLFSMECLAAFLATYPDVRTEFVLGDAAIDLVEENVDLALRVLRAPNRTLHTRLIMTTYWHLVASPAYLEKRGEPTSLQMLASHDCLPFIEQTRAVVWRFDGPKGTVEIPVSGRFGANIVGAVLQAARTGLGIAFLPVAITRLDIQSGRLVNILPDWRRDSGGFYAVLPSRHQVPAAVSAFVDFAIETLAPMAEPTPRSPRARRSNAASLP